MKKELKERFDDLDYEFGRVRAEFRGDLSRSDQKVEILNRQVESLQFTVGNLRLEIGNLIQALKESSP
jgi:archaellum component FlaC